MLSRLVRGVGVVIGLAASLHAPFVFGQRVVGGQYSQQQQQQQQQRQQQQQLQQLQLQPQQVNINGTITEVSRGAIMVADKIGNKTWKVAIPNTAKVEVTGTATVDYLAPNLTVDFKTELDEYGAMKDKVSEMTVIAPSAEQPLGIFSGADAAGGPINASAGGKTTKHTAKSVTVHGTPPAGPCRIVGKLVNSHGKLSVQVHGTQPIELALADEVNVKVEFADYSVAISGDNITVKGTSAPGKMVMGRVVPNTTGIVQATDVKITLAETLTGTKKKKSTSHPKKDKDEGTPSMGE
jgi:hypothetical protein